MKVYALQPNFFTPAVDLMADDGLSLTTRRRDLDLLEGELAAMNGNYRERTRHMRKILEVKAEIRKYKKDLEERGLLKRKERK
jgi:hypothetical protein